ncbi:tRNA (adenosine(37)-N6)-threonylcarbamoyltransferase complex transferase subunit TsaD, partial [Patescibacteria group bacterium]|nr:tRNA (adenosine(37)-N6)-threonylcarbamoyltransferase complex transferase subunit TsaD [Patescibacteria group bacterium]
MKILGIETSCDDTGIAIIEGKGKSWPHFRILSNVVASQIEVHKKYGGVYPTLAKREHIASLPIVLKAALKKAKLKEKNLKIDAVAVTYGPGLSPCLWTGINFAKELAKKYNIPLIPVDHMEGHLLVGLFSQSIENFQTNQKHIFPAIALLVSGGHTQLMLVKAIGKYKLLGETRDDAAGEAFDKTARMLGLSYPGGPEIAKLAAMPKLGLGVPKPSLGIDLPRPMLYTKDFDFSFSGLKTAVLYDYKKRTKKVRESKEYIRAMAKEIQQAIIDVLLKKTIGEIECLPEETQTCGQSEVLPCKLGLRSCNEDTFLWNSCVGEVAPSGEVRDNIDNDCDGTADEDYISYGTSCGVGECASAGSTSCVAGSEEDSCSAGTPSTEVCEDSLDENCDGTVDEGCECTNGDTQQCGTTDVGACEYGIQTCSAGVWGSCAGEIESTVETCNNIDDNCDGSTDE